MLEIVGWAIWLLSIWGGTDANVAEPVEPTPVVVGIEGIICSHSWPCGEAIDVSWCESGHQPDAHSDTNDTGIFQLHSPVWQPYFTGLGYGWAPYDPAWNVWAAHHIWELHGWHPWRYSASCHGVY